MKFILSSIEDKTVTEIIINSDLAYRPVVPPKAQHEEFRRTLSNCPSTDVIFIDDD